MRARGWCGLLALVLGGCAFGKQLAADPGELADYRAYRAALHPARRIALALHYLQAHPKGLWAEEVKRAVTAEDDAYYEHVKASRARAWEYLALLPNGPHAEAAQAVVAAFDIHLEELAMDHLIQETRRTEAMLDRAKDARRRLTTLLLGDVRALLDPHVYGAHIPDVPEALKLALSGMAHPTIAWLPRTHVENVPYVILSPRGSDDRVAEVKLTVLLSKDGAIVEGRLSGSDLFTRWLEAEENEPVDDANPAARARAAAHAAERLFGLFEATLPSERCAAESPDEVIARRCDGWLATAWMGSRPGEPDVIAIRGRSAAAPP